MSASPEHRPHRLPASIWALGLVSMFMDISSEMIHALLPVYMVVGLGASAVAVGLIEGIAEATAAITRIFSGAVSDWLGRRKALAALGYGLAAITKPVFPLAPSVGWLVAARFVDRVGKGIRGAPRDALVADLAPAALRGAAFGLRQTLDTLGAFAGPLLAIGLMWAFANDFKAVFWVAVLPAFIAVALILWVREPHPGSGSGRLASPLAAAARRHLAGSGLGGVIAIASLFTLARFSEAFLVLKAQGAGLPLMWVPLVLVVMNLAYAMTAWPMGALSDRMARRTILAMGIGILVAADLVLAAATSLPMIGLGLVLWGLHMGMTQGLFAAMVADHAPAPLRGTAFGLFHLFTGIAALAASLVAGALWQWFGPAATFQAGAGFALLALAALYSGRAR